MSLLIDPDDMNFKCSCVNKFTHHGGILFVSEYAISLADLYGLNYYCYITSVMCILSLCHLTSISHTYLWINFKKPHVYSCFIVDTMLFSFVGTIRFRNSGQYAILIYFCCNSLISTVHSYLQISNILVNMVGKIG